jgi:hypothetical protein
LSYLCDEGRSSPVIFVNFYSSNIITASLIILDIIVTALPT